MPARLSQLVTGTLRGSSLLLFVCWLPYSCPWILWLAADSSFAQVSRPCWRSSGTRYGQPAAQGFVHPPSCSAQYYSLLNFACPERNAVLGTIVAVM